MKILYIAAECKPFSKTGGVGDVSGELPPAIVKSDPYIELEVVTPFYGKIKVGPSQKPTMSYSLRFHGEEERVEIHAGDLKGVPVSFVKNATYFEGRYSDPYINSKQIPFYDDILRFSFFSKACLELIKQKKPDIVHINDWVLCYLFGWMAIQKMPQKRVLTIHNIGYQGNIGQEIISRWDIKGILDDEDVGPLFIDPHPQWYSVNALRLGLELSDMVNTVSPNYSKEMTEPEDDQRYFEGGKGLNKISKRLFDEKKLIGITNGFEYTTDATKKSFLQMLKKKSEMKKALSKDFANPNNFLLGFVGRAVEQKFKLLTEFINGKSVLAHLLDIPGINIAILATGLEEYEKFMAQFMGRPNYSATIAFDKEKAQQISLGSDVFLMPSLFEPCGITQMESMSNATPPLVRWTGGLVDTVVSHTLPNGTGFGFDGVNRDEVLSKLIETVQEALLLYKDNSDLFLKLQARAFKQRFKWSDAAKEYINKIYKPLME
jgi:starch synthase